MTGRHPFYFLRHGQTDWNVECRCMGSIDIPLNDTGRKQAQDAREYTKKLPLVAIFTSPLSRAHETACMAAVDHAVKPVILPELQERCWGTFEGQIPDPKKMRRRRSVDGTEDISEGAESYEHFFARVSAGLRIAFAAGGPSLLVSHSGVLDAICHALRIPTPDAPNAALFQFECLNGLWRVFNLNESPSQPQHAQNRHMI